MVDLTARLSNLSPEVIKLLTRGDATSGCLSRSTTPTIQRQTRLSEGEVMKLLDAYRQGMPVREICSIWSINKDTVYEHLRRSGVKSNRTNKLGPAEVARAADLYASGLSLKAVGEQLGVDAQTVRNALTRKGVSIRRNR